MIAPQKAPAVTRAPVSTGGLPPGSSNVVKPVQKSF